jgi:hypothetical protein
MVYITNEGKVISNHLQPKKTLDLLRLICRGRTEADKDLCKSFNEKTEDGKNMTLYSNLLQETIASIINVNEESDIDSLFKPGGTTALKTSISGLDDFELISFVVVI